MENTKEYKATMWCMERITNLVHAGILEAPVTLTKEGMAAVREIVGDFVPNQAMIDEVINNLPNAHEVPEHLMRVYKRYLYLCRARPTEDLIHEFRMWELEQKYGKDDSTP